MTFFLQVAVSGIATGAIYGLIAVGYSLTYTTTKTFNFGLGAWVMLGAMLTCSCIVQMGLSPIATLPLLIVAFFLMGVAAERITVSPFLRVQSDLWVISTLATGLILIDLAEIIWGRGQARVPAYLGDAPYRIGEVAVRSQHVLAIVSVVCVYLCMEAFFRHSLYGKAFRAVAQDRTVSSLMGINVRRVEYLSYAASASLAGMAGFLIVPITGAEPHLGTGLGLKAFAVAVVAGLNAPRGILVFGFAFGLLEGLVSAYINTGVRDIFVFTMMMLTLRWFPSGVLNRSTREWRG